MTNTNKKPVIINIAHESCMEYDAGQVWVSGKTHWMASEFCEASSLEEAINLVGAEGHNVIADMCEEHKDDEGYSHKGNSHDNPIIPNSCYIVSVEAVYNEDGTFSHY